MTTIRPRLGDESFTLNGTVYPFMFPRTGGNQGFVSASPFAPKSQIGERTYNDYTAYSVAAFTNLSGGMGQERIGEPTKYYDASNLDARSGQIVLGPLVHTTAAANLVNFTTNPLYTFSLSAYGPIQTEQHAFAAKITGRGADRTPHLAAVEGYAWGKRVTVEVWSRWQPRWMTRHAAGRRRRSTKRTSWNKVGGPAPRWRTPSS